MASLGIYRGSVFHARFSPKKNSFRYPSFFISGDLEEIEKQKGFWFSYGGRFPFGLRPEKFLNNRGGSLKANFFEFLRENQIESKLYKKIELQCYPYALGYVFNPVSFWFCSSEDEKLLAVLVEVNNTFGERHFYWIEKEDRSQISSEDVLRAKKAFHVSPFFPIQGEYRFRFLKEEQKSKVIIDYYQENDLVLSTYISGSFNAINSGNWFRCLVSYGWMTGLVVGRIHWQALIIFLKGIQLFRKPPPPDKELT